MDVSRRNVVLGVIGSFLGWFSRPQDAQANPYAAPGALVPVDDPAEPELDHMLIDEEAMRAAMAKPRVKVIKAGDPIEFVSNIEFDNTTCELVVTKQQLIFTRDALLVLDPPTKQLGKLLDQDLHNDAALCKALGLDFEEEKRLLAEELRLSKLSKCGCNDCCCGQQIHGPSEISISIDSLGDVPADC